MAESTTTLPQLLRAAVDRGFELHETGALEDALAHYDRVLRTPSAANDPVTVESLFAARFDRAVILTELGELELAAEAFAAAAQGLPTDDAELASEVAHELAMAELNRGVCLQLLDRHDEALTVYSAVLGRFPDPADPVLREQVVKAMVNRCATLVALGRRRAAVAAADAALERLDGLEDAWVDEQRTLLGGVREAALSPADR